MQIDIDSFNTWREDAEELVLIWVSLRVMIVYFELGIIGAWIHSYFIYHYYLYLIKSSWLNYNENKKILIRFF